MRARPFHRFGPIVLFLLLVAGLLSSTVGSAHAEVDNPPVPRICGGDLVLLLDASSSIRELGGGRDLNGAADQVVDAASAFLRSVIDSGARVAVVTYDAGAVLQTDFARVTESSMAVGGVHALALGDPGGETGPVPAETTGYSAHVRYGEGTNWDAGLHEARRLIKGAAGGRPAAVVHITDGIPTWHVRADGTSTGVGTPAEHLNQAMSQADLVKSLGAHLFAVGVGPAADHVGALVVTAGPDVFDQSDPDDTLDPLLDDVLLASDPSRLESSLARFAQAACGSSLRVRVVTAPTADGPFGPAEQAIIRASPASLRGYDWVAPDTRPEPGKAQVTDTDGEARFVWTVADADAWVPRVRIEAPAQSGFTVIGAACGGGEGDLDPVDRVGGAFDIDVDVADVVFCELRAIRDPDRATGLDISLDAVAGSRGSCPGGDDVVVAAGHPVTYCASVTNRSHRAADDLTLTTSGIAWALEGREELAPGETLESVVTVGPEEDVVAVLTASATFGGTAVQASDPTVVEVVQPSLFLEKSVDQSFVPSGTPVTYELVVRNLSDVALDEVEVDDPDCGDISGPVKTDDDGDGYLDRGEVWTYTCSATITADLLNVARASAWAVDGAGDRIPGGSVQARSNVSVSVVPSVAGSTQTDGGSGSLSRTGSEVFGMLAGGLGLLGLGGLLLAARRRRG